MRVLLLTPYSPLLQHDHAANDLALPLVKGLASITDMDLHVYAPSQSSGKLESWCTDGVTYHAGSPVHRARVDQISAYPYSARGSWSSESTKEALAVVNKVNPDIVHAEYAQTAEPLLRLNSVPRTSITLHDLPGEVVLKPKADLPAVRYLQQRLEVWKSRRLANAIVSGIDALLVFSQRDRDKIVNARGILSIAPIGINAPAAGWRGEAPHVAAFGGAMWRWENEATAIYLANEVMPAVRDKIPDAELRIFGARPTPAVLELGDRPGVTVVGEVVDYDDEFRQAGVTLAPAMVDAGILMKAIRAMAIGCPVVLNSRSAGPIPGFIDGIHALVADEADEFATRIVDLMQDRSLARDLGRAATGLVRAEFNWERTVEAYSDVFERLLGVSPPTGSDVH